MERNQKIRTYPSVDLGGMIVPMTAMAKDDPGPEAARGKGIVAFARKIMRAVPAAAKLATWISRAATAIEGPSCCKELNG